MPDQSDSSLHRARAGGIATNSRKEGLLEFPGFDLVLGTDTHVGKTIVSAVLLRELRAQEKVPAYLKPVLTGGRGEDPDSDPSRCQEMSGLPGHLLTWMYAFGEPIDPMTAANRAGTSIDPQAIREKIRFLALRHALTGGYLLSLFIDFFPLKLALIFSYIIVFSGRFISSFLFRGLKEVGGGRNRGALSILFKPRQPGSPSGAPINPR